MISKRLCSILLATCGLLALAFVACSENDAAGPVDACEGKVAGTPRPSSSPTVSSHTHHTFALCESDRGQIVDFELSGASHVHSVHLVPDAVDQILDGMTVVSGSGSAAGHAHTIDYTR